MPNFSASQSFSTQGLCSTFRTTDTSPYGNNTENYNESSVDRKIWTFRNSSGQIIKQETTGADVYYSEVAISLLTLNITVDLAIFMKNNQSFSVSNVLLVPCLGV